MIAVDEEHAADCLCRVFRASEFFAETSPEQATAKRLLAILDASGDLPERKKGRQMGPDVWAFRQRTNGKVQICLVPETLGELLGSTAAASLERALLDHGIQHKDAAGKARQQISGTGIGPTGRPRFIVVDFEGLRSFVASTK